MPSSQRRQLVAVLGAMVLQRIESDRIAQEARNDNAAE
jgi:hypothetical protein